MRRTIAALLMTIAAPAFAQDKPQDKSERDYCPERPGLGTPPCTIAPGHVSVETALADWTRDEDRSMRDDTVLVADTLVRIGVSDSIEAQLGFTPFGHDRMRDKSTGTVDRADRVGDASLGVKVNLSHPDGSGFALAVLPFVTIPVGRMPIGAGDGGAGLLVPVTYDLSKAISVEFTPEVDAAVDQDGRGRHLAYSGTTGLAVALDDALTLTGEVQVARDEDPSRGTTQALAGLSAAWMIGKTFQLDGAAYAGLDHAAPDAELVIGVSHLF